VSEQTVEALLAELERLYMTKIATVTAQRDKLLEALKERVGFYYQRGVPHQSQHPHCQCRPCVDARVAEAIKEVGDYERKKAD